MIGIDLFGIAEWLQMVVNRVTPTKCRGLRVECVGNRHDNVDPSSIIP